MHGNYKVHSIRYFTGLQSHLQHLDLSLALLLSQNPGVIFLFLHFALRRPQPIPDWYSW